MQQFLYDVIQGVEIHIQHFQHVSEIYYVKHIGMFKFPLYDQFECISLGKSTWLV